MEDSKMRKTSGAAVEIFAVLDDVIDDLRDNIMKKYGFDEQQVHFAACQAAVQLASVRAMLTANAQHDFAIRLVGQLLDVLSRAFSEAQGNRNN